MSGISRGEKPILKAAVSPKFPELSIHCIHLAASAPISASPFCRGGSTGKLRQIIGSKVLPKHVPLQSGQWQAGGA